MTENPEDPSPQATIWILAIAGRQGSLQRASSEGAQRGAAARHGARTR
jgi:hypothetical protein